MTDGDALAPSDKAHPRLRNRPLQLRSTRLLSLSGTLAKGVLRRPGLRVTTQFSHRSLRRQDDRAEEDIRQAGDVARIDDGDILPEAGNVLLNGLP